MHPKATYKLCFKVTNLCLVGGNYSILVLLCSSLRTSLKQLGNITMMVYKAHQLGHLSIAMPVELNRNPLVTKSKRAQSLS